MQTLKHKHTNIFFVIIAIIIVTVIIIIYWAIPRSGLTGTNGTCEATQSLDVVLLLKVSY